MQRSKSTNETLQSLLRKARTKVGRYESLRTDGENAAADRLIPEMFQLRKEIIASWRAALESGAEPAGQTADEMNFLLRALAPGLRRPARQRTAATGGEARKQTDPGRVSTELIATALRRPKKKPRAGGR